MGEGGGGATVLKCFYCEINGCDKHEGMQVMKESKGWD